MTGMVLRLGYLGSPDAAARIAVAVGDAAVELAEASIAAPFATLRGGAVDVLVTRFDIAEPDLTTGPVLFVEDRVLAVGAGHPLAARDAVDTEDIADHEVFERPEMFPAGAYDQLVPPRSASGRPIRDLPPAPVTLTWRGNDNRPSVRAFVTAAAGAFPSGARL